MAKAQIGALNVKLTANTQGFTKGMRRARGAAKGFQGGVGKLQSSLVGFTAKFVGVTAVIAAFVGTIRRITGAVSEAVTRLDLLAKTSSKLGITTEALSGLRFAAERSGVAVATFDMALQRMTRRLSEAAQDTGEAQAAIKELGLDARLLVRLPLEEQFKKIAGAMVRVRDQSDRVRLSFKLFDSEGVALVNVLNQGARGIERLTKEAVRLGIVIDPTLAKAMEVLTDKTTDAAAAWEGAANSAARMSGGIRGLWQDFSKGVGGSVRQVLDGWDAIISKHRELQDINAFGPPKPGAVAGPGPSPSPAAAAVATDVDLLADLDASLRKGKFDAFQKGLARAEQVIASLHTPMEQYKSEVAEVMDLHKITALNTDQMTTALERLRTKYADVLNPAEKFKEALTETIALDAGRLAASIQVGSAGAARATFAAAQQGKTIEQPIKSLLAEAKQQSTGDRNRERLLETLVQQGEVVQRVGI